MRTSLRASWRRVAARRTVPIDSVNPRGKGTFSFSSLVARYEKFGRPQDVVQIQQAEPVQTISPTQIGVRFLAAPINPADVNTVEGVYGIKNTLPSTPGNEGVAHIESVGSQVLNLRVGDWVIPSSAGFGTWRTHAVMDADDVIRVPNDIPLEYAATLAVNPATAYRLLRDFASLKHGDVVMQNGANSMVGLAVIQMARLMGLRTVNIIRSDRPEADTTLRLLTNLGGDLNVTDSYVNTFAFNEILHDMGGCSLAFNCVGGDIVTEMARSLSPGAIIVTYGGMSKRPINVPIDLLAQKQLTLTGFWVTTWYKQQQARGLHLDRAVMIADIASMIRAKQLTFFFETHDFDDFHWALRRSQEAFAFRKVLLRMDFPDRLEEHDSLTASAYEVFETSTV